MYLGIFMGRTPNNLKTLSLNVGERSFNLGVQSDPSSYRIEEKDSKTKELISPDGTRTLVTVNDKGQLITKIMKPNDTDTTGRLWGNGATGEQVSLQGTILNFIQNLITSPSSTNSNAAWLAQQGTNLGNNVVNGWNSATNTVRNWLNQAKATFYAPGQGDISMQGGTKDRQGKSLIGHRVEDIVDLLKTYKSQGLSKEQALEKLKEGDHYIGVAADHTDPNNKYGTKISINSDALSQRFKLNEIYEGLNFSDLHVKIVDTGGAFVGKGPRRLDIAMANIKTAYDIGKVDLSWSALN